MPVRTQRSVTFTADEYARLSEHAHAAGMTLRQWLRTKIAEFHAEPSRFSPTSDAGVIAARAAQLFQGLLDDGSITAEQYADALTELDRTVILFPDSNQKIHHKNYPYPTNLAIAACGIETHGEFCRTFLAKNIELDPKQIEGLETALRDLPERELDALMKYYRDGMTMQQIADQWGNSPQLVRNYIVKGKRHLRNPIRYRKIRYGLQIDELYSLKRKLNELKQECADILRETEQLQEKLDQIKGKQQADWRERGIDVEKRIEASRTDPEEMGLSVRAYNCLKRAGINTVGQILELESVGSLHKIHHLGKVVVKEIIDKLHELGHDKFDNGVPITL